MPEHETITAAADLHESKAKLTNNAGSQTLIDADGDDWRILEKAAADTDAAGYGQPWVKNASPCEFWFTDDAGNDVPLSTGWYGIALSDETTDLTTGTGKAYWHFPFPVEVLDYFLEVNTAPTGANLIVDVNDSGTTTMSTNKLSIDAGEKTSDTAATPPGITDSSVAAYAEMSADIDQVGSTAAGKGAKLWIKVRRAG